MSMSEDRGCENYMLVRRPTLQTRCNIDATASTDPGVFH